MFIKRLVGEQQLKSDEILLQPNRSINDSICSTHLPVPPPEEPSPLFQMSSTEKPKLTCHLFQEAFPDPFSRKLTLPPDRPKWPAIPSLTVFLSMLYGDISGSALDLWWVINTLGQDVCEFHFCHLYCTRQGQAARSGCAECMNVPSWQVAAGGGFFGVLFAHGGHFLDSS